MTPLDPTILGLAGAAGSGKDTAADYLCTHYGFVRCAFADGLKTMLEALLEHVAHAIGDFEPTAGPVCCKVGLVAAEYVDAACHDSAPVPYSDRYRPSRSIVSLCKSMGRMPWAQ